MGTATGPTEARVAVVTAGAGGPPGRDDRPATPRRRIACRRFGSASWKARQDRRRARYRDCLFGRERPEGAGSPSRRRRGPPRGRGGGQGGSRERCRARLRRESRSREAVSRSALENRYGAERMTGIRNAAPMGRGVFRPRWRMPWRGSRPRKRATSRARRSGSQVRNMSVADPQRVLPFRGRSAGRCSRRPFLRTRQRRAAC